MRIWRMKRKYVTPEQQAWHNMNSLCSPSSKQRKYYYEKGIVVCEDWKRRGRDTKANRKAYEKFFQVLGSRPEGKILGRLDKSKGFEIGNCRWMDKSEAAKGRSQHQKYSYSTDEQLIQELERRGYDTSVLAQR